MNSEYEMVRSFQLAAGQPVANSPTQITIDRLALRCDWIAEEIVELRSADCIVDQLDAVIDIMYFALGALVEIGIYPDEPFRIVHDTNIAKIAADGSADIDERGKVKKPESWRNPRAELLRYIAKMYEAEE